MRLYAARVYLNVYVNREPAAVIPPTKYPMIHDAVLNACDAKDGVKDGVIEHPPACSFDFTALHLQGRRCGRLSDQAASRDGEGDVVADHRP
jgi:feruloyl esterase